MWEITFSQFACVVVVVAVASAVVVVVAVMWVKDTSCAVGWIDCDADSMET